MVRTSVVWILIVFSGLFGDASRYLYEQTCSRAASDDPEASLYERKHILKMNVCTQISTTPAGMAEIIKCEETAEGKVYLSSTLYSRTDCASSHVIGVSETFPAPYDSTMSTSCTGSTTSATRWQCMDDPEWLTSPGWISVVRYSEEDTSASNRCPVLTHPHISAYTLKCVQKGESDYSVRYGYTNTTVDSLEYLEYRGKFCECANEDCTDTVIPVYRQIVAEEVVTMRENTTDCYGVAEVVSNDGSGSGDDAGNNGGGGSGDGSDTGYGYFVSPLSESRWAENNRGEGASAIPPVNIMTVVFTLAGACSLCCFCICVLGYFANHFAIKAEQYDGGRENIDDDDNNNGKERESRVSSARLTTFLVDNPIIMQSSSGMDRSHSIVDIGGSALDADGILGIEDQQELRDLRGSTSGTGTGTGTSTSTGVGGNTMSARRPSTIVPAKRPSRRASAFPAAVGMDLASVEHAL